MKYTGWCENDFNVQGLLAFVLAVRSSMAAATSARSCAQRARLKIDLAYDTPIPRIYFTPSKKYQALRPRAARQRTHAVRGRVGRSNW